MTNQEQLRAEAREYYALCDRARALGIDTTATEETSVNPDAVAKLRTEVAKAERELQPMQRPMSEIRRLLAEDSARWDALAEVWNDLTVAEQKELVATAREMAERS